MDNILLVSIILVFAGALLGAFIQRRSLDRALKAFNGFFVSVDAAGNGRHWGRLRVFPNGIELVHMRPNTPDKASGKTSDILFDDQLGGVLSLRRYHEELTPQNQQRRRREVARTFHPSGSRRMLRWLRNTLNTLKDAISEAMGMIMARAQSRRGATPLQGQDKQLQSIGSQTLSAAGTAYDPILERYIGRRVYAWLAPETESGTAAEFHGVLQEYSPAWLSLLDCRIKTEQHILLSDTQRLELQRHLDFEIAVSTVGELHMRIDNRSAAPVDIKRLQAKDYAHPIECLLAPGDNHEITITDLPPALLTDINAADLPLKVALVAPERQTGAAAADGDDSAETLAPGIALPALTLVFESEQEVDVCLPRSRARIRHGGEYIGRTRARR